MQWNADGSEEFFDAAAVLSRPSQGSSRYLSLAESEFEDAASELEGKDVTQPGCGTSCHLSNVARHLGSRQWAH